MLVAGAGAGVYLLLPIDASAYGGAGDRFVQLMGVLLLVHALIPSLASRSARTAPPRQA